MRAAYIKRHGGPDVLEVGEIPKPAPRADRVLVKIKYAALNHLDIWVREGLPGLELTFPHTLCGDGSGVVDSVGELVSSVKPGDEVIVHPGLSCGKCERCFLGEESLCRGYQILGEQVSGTSAEYVSVPAANIFRKPASMDFKEAAAFPLVFTTAWQMAIRRAGITAGDTVLIHAAGSGVSMALIQIARLVGATVIATAGQDRKLEFARKLGANHTINYTTEDFVAKVRALTEKRGVDIVLDHTGVDNWKKNFQALRWGGTIVICGATSGGNAAVDLKEVFFRQIKILGSTMGSKGDFPRLLKLASERRLVAVVDRVFPLTEVREAHRYMELREVVGKVLLEP